MVDKKVLDKIIKTADLKKNDKVLEIGPGLGVLTVELAKRAKKVAAVEFDERFKEILKVLTFSHKNIEIIEADILKLNIEKLGFKDRGYKLVANLPYNITSPVLRKFLENRPRPEEFVVMVQKEVAKRITASPGKMSLLSISVQFYGQPEIVGIVSKKSFWPMPEIDSAILKIKNIKERKKVDKKRFFQIVRIGFSSRRKQLQNNLAAGFKVSNEQIKDILSQLKIKKNARAQELSIEQWIKLADSLKFS